MKRNDLLVLALASAMLTTGCVGGRAIGSGSGGGYLGNYDDSAARNTQEAAAQQSNWVAQQATQQQTDAANQSAVDASNAAAAAAVGQ